MNSLTMITKIIKPIKPKSKNQHQMLSKSKEKEMGFKKSFKDRQEACLILKR